MKLSKKKKKNLKTNILLVFLLIIAGISMYLDFSGKYDKHENPNNEISEIIEGKCFRYTKKGHIVNESNKCDNVDYLEIPSSIDGINITEIDENAAIGGYKYIMIPSTIQVINKNAFSGENLEGIINESQLLTFDNNSIKDNSGIKLYTVLNPNVVMSKCYLNGKMKSCDKVNTELIQLTTKITKEVPIVMNASTQIEGKSIDKLELSKDKATIKGYEVFLDNLEYVNAAPANKTLEDGKIYSIEISIPDKPYLYEIEQQNITATVRLDDSISKNIELKVNYINLNENKEVEIDLKTNINVIGTINNLELLNTDDIYLYVDLNNLYDGEYELEPIIKFNNSFIKCEYKDKIKVVIKSKIEEQ